MDDETDRICEATYLLDEGANITSICVGHFFDYQSMCFRLDGRKIDKKLYDHLNKLKENISIPIIEKIGTFAGVIYRMSYNISIDLYVNIDNCEYVKIDKFMVDIPLTRTAGMYWSPQRFFGNIFSCLCNRNQNITDDNESITYILGTDILSKYSKQNIPINVITNDGWSVRRKIYERKDPVNLRVVIRKIPLKSDEYSYVTLFFRAGTIFVQNSASFYSHHSKTNQNENMYELTRNICLVCFDTKEEFDNYIKSSNRVIDGGFVETQDLHRIFFNNQDFLIPINTQNLQHNPNNITDDLCGTGFIYSNAYV